MTASRTITRLHEDKTKRLVHVFSDSGYELTTPMGFRDRNLKVGRRLDEEEFDALRAAARAYEQGRAERRSARRERLAATRPRAGTVTGLRHDAKRGRTYIDLDGVYGFTVSLDQVAEAGLWVGKDLDEPAVAELSGAYDVARIGAMIERLGAYRPRTASEVRDRLARKGITGPVVDAAIVRRTGEFLGVLPDDEFASWFAEHRGVPRGKGFGALVPELRRLGVGDAAIESARARYGTDEALEIALEKAARGLDLADPKSRQRFVARLARRGFGYGAARDYLEQADQSDEQIDEAAAEEG